MGGFPHKNTVDTVSEYSSDVPFAIPISDNVWISASAQLSEISLSLNDWIIKVDSEIVFDCNSSGIPHKHAMTKMTDKR